MFSFPNFLAVANLPPVGLKTLTVGLLYLGPDTIMPLASILAAGLGLLLIVWRHVWRFVKRIYKFAYHKITRKPIEEPEPVETPVEIRDESHTI